MRDYLCKISSTAGRRGQVVALDDTTETAELLRSGIICEIQQTEKPAETKTKKAKK